MRRWLLTSHLSRVLRMKPTKSLSQMTAKAAAGGFHSLRAAVIVATTISLGACGHGTSTQQLVEAVRASVSKGPSESAYKDLRRELKRVDEDCERFAALSRCQSAEFLEVQRWAASELAGMLLTGVERGEGWAIKQAFYSFSDKPPEEVRQRVADRIILSAKSETAPASVLLQAGLLYKGGTYTHQNFAAAAQYLKGAWLMGEVRAASALEELSLIDRDSANAYLWAVRCVSPCASSRELDGYLKDLSPQQVGRIQQAAREPSILTVPSGLVAFP